MQFTLAHVFVGILFVSLGLTAFMQPDARLAIVVATCAFAMKWLLTSLDERSEQQ